MKRTESIQVRLPDDGRLHLRVSPEEKEMIKSKAEAEKMSMSSLILRSIDKIDDPITVNLDNSDLRDLLIQVRRINANVRTFFKNVDFSEHFTLEDRKELEQQLVRNENIVLDEYKRVKKLVSKMENLNREEATKLAEEIKNGTIKDVEELN